MYSCLVLCIRCSECILFVWTHLFYNIVSWGWYRPWLSVHVYRVIVLWIPLDCPERSSGSLTHCGTQSTCCNFRRDENGSRVTWFHRQRIPRQFVNKKRYISHENILSVSHYFHLFHSFINNACVQYSLIAYYSKLIFQNNVWNDQTHLW